MTQNTQIIRHCKKEWLTAMEALLKYDCNSLSSRICEIQRKGYLVDKQWLKLHSGKRVIQYRIVGRETPFHDVGQRILSKAL